MNELEILKSELEKCQQESQANLAGWKRAKADYLNLLREIEKNKQDWVNFAALDLIKELIPVRNGFDQLILGLPDDLSGSIAAGLKQMQKLLIDFFEKNGVERIKTQGEQFDPAWHEAVAREKMEGVPIGTIIKEITPGYKMNNKLIIPPTVVVGD